MADIERARHIDDIKPEEYDKYCIVPGWRVWKRNIFDSPIYVAAASSIEANELALRVTQFSKGYRYLSRKIAEAQRALHPNKPRSPLFLAGTDQPSYLLEPLAEELVSQIDKEGEAAGPLNSIDRPIEILRSDDLRQMLEEPEPMRWRPGMTFPSFDEWLK